MFHGTAFFSIMTLMWAWGGDWWDEQRRTVLLNSPESVAALQWLYDLWNRHQASPPPSYTSQQGQNYNQLFGAGRLASFHFGGLWDADQHSKNAALDWAVSPIPKGPRGRFGYGFMAIYAVSSNAKNPDGAWEWIKFMTSPEGYESKGGDLQASPARKSMAAQAQQKMRSLGWMIDRGGLNSQTETFQTVRLARFVPDFGPIQTEALGAMGKIWRGEASPKAAMDEVTPRIQQMLNAAMAQVK
jgi:ABC-type glycerol-3-phosphate transport system substrate-binding protein